MKAKGLLVIGLGLLIAGFILSLEDSKWSEVIDSMSSDGRMWTSHIDTARLETFHYAIEIFKFLGIILVSIGSYIWAKDSSVKTS